MRALTTVLFALALTGPSATAQEADGPPGNPPHLWRASAAEVDGKVVVQIARAWPARSKSMERPGADIIIWKELREVTIGETVHAYDVDGEPMAANEVLKKLQMPKGVAVFVQIYKFDPPKPPAFYTQLLREGTVILVADGSDLYELAP